MFPSINPKETAAWKKLQAAYNDKKDLRIKDLFAEDPGRFVKYSVQTEHMLFNFSKNNIDDETLGLIMLLGGMQIAGSISRNV